MKKALIIIVITIVITLCACSLLALSGLLAPGIYASYRLRPVRETSRAFMAALQNEDLETAFKLCSPELQALAGSPEGLLRTIKQESSAQIESFQSGVSMNKADFSKVDQAFGVTYKDGRQMDYWLTLVPENDQNWMVNGVSIKHAAKKTATPVILIP